MTSNNATSVLVEEDSAVRAALDAVYVAWADNDPDAFVGPYAEDATAALPGPACQIRRDPRLHGGCRGRGPRAPVPHGGGFISGSMYTHRKLFAHLAQAVGSRALIVNYRLLPEGVHSGPVDDALAAYRWLLDQGIDASHVALTGDSAGAGLSITTHRSQRSRRARTGSPRAGMAARQHRWARAAVRRLGSPGERGRP